MPTLRRVADRVASAIPSDRRVMPYPFAQQSAHRDVQTPWPVSIVGRAEDGGRWTVYSDTAAPAGTEPMIRGFAHGSDRETLHYWEAGAERPLFIAGPVPRYVRDFIAAFVRGGHPAPVE